MLNVISIMGRLVANPELRKTATGVSTTTIRVACDRNFVKANAERETDFFDIVAWRTTAEFACKYFIKGQLMAVNGSLQTRRYEKNGSQHTVYEIVADNIHFAESKQSSQTPAQNNAPPKNQQAPEDGPQTIYDGFEVIEDGEDLPF